MNKTAPPAKGLSIYSFSKKVLRPFHWHMVAFLIVGLVWAIDLSFRPYLIKIILDRLEKYPAIEAFQHLSVPAYVYVGMSLLIVINFRCYDIIRLKFIIPLKKHITQQMVDHMMGHSHDYYQNNFAGSLSNKINDVVQGITQMISIISEQFFSNSLALLVAIFTLWQVDIKFALAMMVWIFIFLTVSITVGKKSSLLSDTASEIRSTLTGQVVDILTNMMSIRTFVGHRYENKKLNTTLDKVVAAEQTMAWYFFKIWTFQGSSFIIMQALSLWLLIQGRKNGVITTGDFALVLTLNIYIIDCMWNMSTMISLFTEHYGKVVQGLRITTQPHTIQNLPNASELRVHSGTIQFDQVTFQYKQAKPLFIDKSITIKAGTKIGLVGFSGSGKTTFVNLILRLFDIQSGRILIDNQDIATVTQESLRASIAIIPQDPSLFHRSLWENIRYGKINATDEEVIEAAKKAHAHEFITSIPDGYNALVGERGIKLSGGQRQRISIARAILKNSPILILDEATSALDSVTEHYIQDSLQNLMQNKTVIVIAHRLSTLLNLDRILVFDQGMIVEEGTHLDLIAKNGLYAKLWDSQVGGFLLDNANVKEE